MEKQENVARCTLGGGVHLKRSSGLSVDDSSVLRCDVYRSAHGAAVSDKQFVGTGAFEAVEKTANRALFVVHGNDDGNPHRADAHQHTSVRSWVGTIKMQCTQRGWI